MSRGGRRRRGRRGGNRPTPKPQSEQQDQTKGSSSRRRRRRKPTEVSVLESMSSRPATLQMLPADGTVLDELISDLKTEYGTPATPQEYRLTIRVLGEERERPAPLAEAETAGEQVELGEEGEQVAPLAAVDGQPAKRRRSRRRGRRRRQDAHGGQSQDGQGDAVNADAPPKSQVELIETTEDPEP